MPGFFFSAIMNDKKNYGFTTTILHNDRRKGIEHGSLHKPVHTSVAFGYSDARQLASVFQGKEPGFRYGRQGNPTVSALEDKVNKMEDGVATLCFATGMGAGTAASVPIALLLINTVGWRWAWVVFGLAIWAVILPSYGFLMRRRPEDLGLLPDGVAPQSSPVAGSPGSEPAAVQEEVNWTLSQAVRTPVLWFILLALTMYMFSTSGVLFLRVPYWNEMGVSARAIAFGVAADPFTVIFAMLFFGYLAERYPVRFMAVVGGVWRALSMVPLLIGSSHAGYVFLHNIIWGIGSGAFASAQNLMIPTYYGRTAQGAIRGISLPLMIAAGALGSPAVAYLVDAGVDVTLVWQLGMGLMLFAGLMFFFLKPPKPPRELAKPTAEDVPKQVKQ